MTKTFTVSCLKNHTIDIKIVGQALKFTRDFEGEGWNCCSDHSMILKDIMVGKDCMKCGHLVAEAQ